MRTEGQRRSDNVEDRRGQRPAGGGFGSAGGGMSGGGGLILQLILSLLRGGKGGFLLLIIGGFLLFRLLGSGLLAPGSDLSPGGGDSEVTVQLPGGFEESPRQEEASPKEVPFEYENKSGRGSSLSDEEEMIDFLKVVLAGTEDIHSQLFAEHGETYHPPKLVIYEDAVNSGCGFTGSQVGPFYCPADSTVYIDLSFFRDLADQYGAAGDFAIAYVLAHEVGHHVQNELGISDQVQQARARMSEQEFNRLSVRLELQADYLAGVWAHYAGVKDLLEEGDIEEALNAANAIGDDTLQKKARGTVVPDSFTHGTSEQRSSWFHKGFRTGSYEEWDTFNIAYDQLMTEDTALQTAA